MTYPVSLLIALGITATVLGGCAYSEINPEAAAEDVRRNTGYYELEGVEPGEARLVMRASGAGFPVSFSVSTDAQSCQGLKNVGKAANTGHGVVYPWIARMTQRSSGTEPYLVYDAQPEQPIQVQGYGMWSSVIAKGVPQESGDCGPLTVRFMPQGGHAYTVDYVWGTQNGRYICTLSVKDAIDRDNPVPVTTEPVTGCAVPATEKSWFNKLIGK